MSRQQTTKPKGVQKGATFIYTNKKKNSIDTITMKYLDDYNRIVDNATYPINFTNIERDRCYSSLLRKYYRLYTEGKPLIFNKHKHVFGYILGRALTPDECVFVNRHAIDLLCAINRRKIRNYHTLDINGFDEFVRHHQQKFNTNFIHMIYKSCRNEGMFIDGVNIEPDVNLPDTNDVLKVNDNSYMISNKSSLPIKENKRVPTTISDLRNNPFTHKIQKSRITALNSIIKYIANKTLKSIDGKNFIFSQKDVSMKKGLYYEFEEESLKDFFDNNSEEIIKLLNDLLEKNERVFSGNFHSQVRSISRFLLSLEKYHFYPIEKNHPHLFFKIQKIYKKVDNEELLRTFGPTTNINDVNVQNYIKKYSKFGYDSLFYDTSYYKDFLWFRNKVYAYF